MDLILYNSLSRTKEKFRPGNTKGPVRLYTCGPTVYRSQHIGNYRTYIFEDILRRTLMLHQLRVRHIMNITDVGHLVSDDDTGEDKVEKEARAHGKSAWEIATYYEKEFISDLAGLNILKPTKIVRATDHIKEQIDLIRQLEKKGFTYLTSDGVYFDTSLVKTYGALAGRRENEITAGKRVSLKEKRNSTDFALWKLSKPKEPKRQMEWESPWGVGFPGWHIECSAMSMKYLGSTLDIHCGGIDHKEIHHPNEIAQSEAATGKPFARFWMHGAFLTVKGEKMAKSSPETNITLSTIRERGFDPLDFRYFALGTHYRKPLSFSWEALAGAKNARLALTEAYRNIPARPKKSEKIFRTNLLAALNDDLNTPQALAVIRTAIRQGASKTFLLWADHAVGLNIKKLSLPSKAPTIPSTVKALVMRREELRSKKDWKEADIVRDEILKLGFTVKDTPSGPAIHKQ